MNDDDFRTLEAVLRSRFERIGAPELANDRNFDVREGEIVRRMNSRDRVIEMLRTFQRYLSIQDRATFESSLSRIRTVLGSDDGPSEVIVERPDDGTPSLVRDLGSAPDLGALRRDLDRLIGEILESPYDQGVPG